jgi:hypothetical protein
MNADEVLLEVRRAQRHARAALKLARAAAAHHGVESWFELDWGHLGEFDPPALLADTLAELRQVLDEIEAISRS